MEIMDKDELARLLKRKPSTVTTDMARNPERVPPFFKLPGSKRPLWYRETVDAWVAVHAEAAVALQSQLRR